MHPEQLHELLVRRRTIKPVRADGSPNYTEQPVPDEIIQDLLQNANWAPTHGLTEPWRFTVFTGAARRSLAEFLVEAYQRLTPPDQVRPAKQENLRRNVLQAPCVISLGLKRHAGKIPVEEEIIAVACAVQNLHLTATAHGLGGFWSTQPIFDHPETKQYLGLEPTDRCLGMFFIGYPSGPWPARTPGPIADKVQWRRG
ncbi:MAG: nitroreductase [Planctomycetota bacterium]|nr:nitroreductase [Planctomycetota bacterium]